MKNGDDPQAVILSHRRRICAQVERPGSGRSFVSVRMMPWLQVMEAIGEDLSQEGPSLQSPAWHETLLRGTTLRVPSGPDQNFDWQEAKKETEAV